MLYTLIQKLSHMKYIVIIVSFLKTNRYIMLRYLSFLGNKGDKVNTCDRDVRYVVREKRAKFDKQKQARNIIRN